MVFSSSSTPPAERRAISRARHGDREVSKRAHGGGHATGASAAASQRRVRASSIGSGDADARASNGHVRASAERAAVQQFLREAAGGPGALRESESDSDVDRASAQARTRARARDPTAAARARVSRRAGADVGSLSPSGSPWTRLSGTFQTRHQTRGFADSLDSPSSERGSPAREAHSAQFQAAVQVGQATLAASRRDAARADADARAAAAATAAARAATVFSVKTHTLDDTTLRISALDGFAHSLSAGSVSSDSAPDDSSPHAPVPVAAAQRPVLSRMAAQALADASARRRAARGQPPRSVGKSSASAAATGVDLTGAARLARLGERLAQARGSAAARRAKLVAETASVPTFRVRERDVARGIRRARANGAALSGSSNTTSGSSAAVVSPASAERARVRDVRAAATARVLARVDAFFDADGSSSDEAIIKSARTLDALKTMALDVSKIRHSTARAAQLASALQKPATGRTRGGASSGDGERLRARDPRAEAARRRKALSASTSASPIKGRARATGPARHRRGDASSSHSSDHFVAHTLRSRAPAPDVVTAAHARSRGLGRRRVHDENFDASDE